jgi:hypothetical protein
MDKHISGALMEVNSAALPHVISAALWNTRMRTVEEVRRLRLQELRDECGGKWSPLNDRLGLTKTDSTLSQILNASTGSKTSKPKTMGSPLARRLEAAFGKELGWMDTDPDCQAWPFGDRVDRRLVVELPEPLFSEAVGALNEVLRRAPPAPTSQKRRNAGQ